MKLKVKKLTETATIPFYSKKGDAGLDLIATSKEENAMFVEYGTGLAFEIPPGFVGYIFPRSSISKYHLSLANSVGVIDSGYRGEVKVRFKKTTNSLYETLYNVGDKVCQLIVMPVPIVELEQVEELSNTERGAGGFGSSGV
jgi:dUTP pyrophosphatase